MKIKLKNRWFAPTRVKRRNKIQRSAGRLYKPGIHIVPDNLRDSLPTSAVVLDDPADDTDGPVLEDENAPDFSGEQVAFDQERERLAEDERKEKEQQQWREDQRLAKQAGDIERSEKAAEFEAALAAEKAVAVPPARRKSAKAKRQD